MAIRGVMGASVSEKKMYYPVMTERQLALRWKISLKTLRRLRTCSPTEPSQSLKRTYRSVYRAGINSRGSRTENSSIPFRSLNSCHLF